MASKLLNDGFVERFSKHLVTSTDIWLASAWVTSSQALEDLTESGQALRALVGIHGNATDPACLDKILEKFGPDSLRIVGNGPLFHPKIYLFRRDRGKTIAWIGSANFTGGGLAGNREILLETDSSSVVSQVERWFKAQWETLLNQNVEAILSDYRQRRRTEPVGNLMSIVEPAALGATARVTQVEFEPTPDRAAPPYTGQVTFTSVAGEEKSSYKNSTEALCLVLDRLQRADGSLLEKCARNRAFQQHHRAGGTSWWVSRHRNRIKEIRAKNRDLSQAAEVYKRGILPAKLECGWWVSRDRSASQYWKLVRTAVCDIAEIKLVPNADQCGL